METSTPRDSPLSERRASLGGKAAGRTAQRVGEIPNQGKPASETRGAAFPTG